MLSDRAKELEQKLKHLRELIDSPTPIENQTTLPLVPKPKARPSQRKLPPVLTKVVQYNLAGTPEWQEPKHNPLPGKAGALRTEPVFRELAEELASTILKTMARNINEPPAVASRRLQNDIHQTLLDAADGLKEYFTGQPDVEAPIPLFNGKADSRSGLNPKQ